jgi:hypothetical protein
MTVDLVAPSPNRKMTVDLAAEPKAACRLGRPTEG